MRFIKTDLPGVIVIEPTIYEDKRGFFMETYRKDKFLEADIPGRFVQDNHSSSTQSTIRGLHFQEPHAQGKLVRVVKGEIFDVAVDVRKGSPHFSRWIGIRLSQENGKQLWIPPGFAHGFCVLSERADVIYKCTTFYAPKAEKYILWNDPDIGIKWPIDNPVTSEKDANAPSLKDALTLPEYQADQ